MVELGADIGFSWVLYPSTDAENTVVGFNAVGPENELPYLSDLDEPGRSVPITAGYLPGEERANVALVLGAPDP